MMPWNYSKWEKVMKIDRLNSVQNTAITYTPTKYGDSDEVETANKKDILTLSKEAQQFLAANKASKKNNKQETEKNTGNLGLDMLRRYMENSRKKENKGPNMLKCFKIAARISNGHKVPLKDMKYLRENAPELYKNALLFKKHNPKPKKYKSCLDKEDEEYMRQKQTDLFGTSVGAEDGIVLSLDE